MTISLHDVANAAARGLIRGLSRVLQQGQDCKIQVQPGGISAAGVIAAKAGRITLWAISGLLSQDFSKIVRLEVMSNIEQAITAADLLRRFEGFKDDLNDVRRLLKNTAPQYGSYVSQWGIYTDSSAARLDDTIQRLAGYASSLQVLRIDGGLNLRTMVECSRFDEITEVILCQIKERLSDKAATLQKQVAEFAARHPS